MGRIVEINGKKLEVTFGNEKIRNLFMKFCEQSPKIGVDWEKFRKLDKLGIFSTFRDQELSCRWRTHSLRKAGLCYYCGVRPAIKAGNMCQECIEGVKTRHAARVAGLKAEKLLKKKAA